MRIISGKWKGKRLMAPKNLPARPTTDFAKEALFNILNHRFYLDEIKVLDLFAGIGGISLEFASRNAVLVHSVEQFGKAAQFISDTAKQLELNQIEVYRQDVFQFLKKENHPKFDIVFADPPFDMEPELYAQIIDIIFKNEWLESDGLLIIEHEKRQSFAEIPEFLEQKKYGNVNFSFFESISDDEEE